MFFFYNIINKGPGVLPELVYIAMNGTVGSFHRDREAVP